MKRLGEISVLIIRRKRKIEFDRDPGDRDLASPRITVLWRKRTAEIIRDEVLQKGREMRRRKT